MGKDTCKPYILNKALIFKIYIKKSQYNSAAKKANQFSSVAQSCPTLCDPMNCSMPGFPVLHCLPKISISGQ